MAVWTSCHASAQALLSLRRRVERLDLVARVEGGVHLVLHVLVVLAGLERQLDHDVVYDGRAQVEPVRRLDRQADVAQLVLDLDLGDRQRLDPVARPVGPEPPLREGGEGAAQARTCVDEPRLPPEVLEAVAGRRAGELDQALDAGVGDAAQGLGALAALAQPEPLDLGGLVQDHRGVGPLVAPVRHQPDDLLVVGGVDLRRRPHGGDALALSAHDRHDVHALQVVPLEDLLGPRRRRHAQRCYHQRRAVLDHLQDLQRRQGRDRLAGAHAGPDRDALSVQDVVDDQRLVRTGGELLARAHARYFGGGT